MCAAELCTKGKVCNAKTKHGGDGYAQHSACNNLLFQAADGREFKLCTKREERERVDMEEREVRVE